MFFFITFQVEPLINPGFEDIILVLLFNEIKMGFRKREFSLICLFLAVFFLAGAQSYGKDEKLPLPVSGRALKKKAVLMNLKVIPVIPLSNCTLFVKNRLLFYL